MRRILIIILIVVLVITGVWYFYVRPKTSGTAPVPNILKPFFPSSTSTNDGSFTDTIPGTIPGGSGTTASTPSAFKQMTGQPIAGYTLFTLSNKVSIPSTDPSNTSGQAQKKTTIQTVIDHYVRYVSRGNGYVYEIKNDSVPLQITNIFIPNVYEADFMDNNNTAILRFLHSDNQTIATYSVPIPPLNTDGTRTQKTGTYLADNISEVAVSPDETTLARITTDNNGAIVSTSNSLGKSIKAIIRSPFTEWLPSWVGKTIYVQTKAASVADGFLYKIDQVTTRLSRILGTTPGLTTSISPDGNYILYSESTATSFNTKLFNTKTNATSNINLAILPEKCAWLQNDDLICGGNNTVPSATYPDAWYAGTTHFADQIYRINTASNTYTVLFNGLSQAFDMTNLQVDESASSLYFIDKTSGLLWKFDY